jgi:hypothetical protein
MKKGLTSARECAPKRCTCGAKLGRPSYGYPWLNAKETTYFGYEWCAFDAPIKEKVWHIKCTCGLRHIWSFHQSSNGCWKVRSDLPLFDSHQILVVA